MELNKTIDSRGLEANTEIVPFNVVCTHDAIDHYSICVS